MTEEDIKQAIIPADILMDWINFYNFLPGQYIILATDDPEKKRVLYIRP